MDAKIGAWRESLRKGALLCHEHGHHGDASTIDDVADHLLNPLLVIHRISRDQKAELFGLIHKYAEAKAKVMLSSVDELKPGSEFNVAADSLRSFIDSITEAQ